MMKKILNIAILALSAFAGISFLAACGGGGGGGGGGGTGGSTPPGSTSFEAPGNADLVGDQVTFTVSTSGRVLIFTLPADDLTVIQDTNSGRNYQVTYLSGKFGGNTESKNGFFRISETGAVGEEFELNVIWTSVNEAAFNGTVQPDKFDDAGQTPVTGTIQRVPD